MERSRSVAVGTTLLGLLAIAATAGFYADRSAPGAGGSTSGPGATASWNEQVGFPAWLIENFLLVAFAGAGLALLVGAALVAWFRGREGLAAMARLLARVTGAGLLVGLFYVGVRHLYEYVAEEPTQPPPVDGGATGGAPGAGSGGTGGAAADGGITTLVVLAAFLGLFLLFTYYALQRRRGESHAGGTSASRKRTAVETGEGDRDGPAVDVTDVPQSNAVYRAWREMATRAVDGDATVTASEVARAAVRSGLDRDAVATLTDLFEEVRYGDRAATDERERRAKAALRAIEDGREAGS